MSTILSYDGFGVNDARDPYRPRIATFSKFEYGDEFGKLFAMALPMRDFIETVALGNTEPERLAELARKLLQEGETC